jgi:Flp pilus assembly protein TadB
MILTQLGIAPVIVTTTYVALIGALALGTALAFGLGGREAAADIINSSYRKAQEQADTVRQDAQLARERGHRDSQRAHERADAPAQPDEQDMPRSTHPSSQQTPGGGPGQPR